MPKRRSRVVQGFDTETTGLNPYQGDRIFSFCIADAKDILNASSLTEAARSVYIERVKIGCRSELLQDWLDDTSIEKVAHHLKFDYSMLVVGGYRIPEDTVWHCTMVASQVLRNLTREHGLDTLTHELGGDPGGTWMMLDRKIERLGEAYGGYHNIPEHLMRQYQAADGIRLMLLYHTLIPELRQDPKLWADYRNEIDLVLAVQRMEQRGMLLDEDGVRDTLARCERELDKARDDLALLVGPEEYFNLSSDHDVRRLLFERFKLPIIKYTKTNLPCADKDVIAELRENHMHESLNIVQRYKSYKRGHSIISGYRELADSGGYIHSSINTNGANRTGRLSSENPNLQNVSKDKNRKNPYIVSARGCFRAPSGCVLLDVDQSGIEIRMIIQAAGPSKMMTLLQRGEHPHLVAVRGFYGERFRSKSEDKDVYDAGKNGHFCICYGGELETFASTVMLPMGEAERAYNWYCSEFPEIAELANRGAEEVRRTEKIVTPFGRTLRIPHGKHYAWLNYYIQGTAAGVIKRGIVRVDDYLRRRWTGKAWLVLTVHDSILIVFDAETFYRNQLEVYLAVSNLMTHIPEVDVKLDVEWKLTEGRWNEAKEFDPRPGAQTRLAV